jgi:hypothetical protein
VYDLHRATPRWPVQGQGKDANRLTLVFGSDAHIANMFITAGVFACKRERLLRPSPALSLAMVTASLGPRWAEARVCMVRARGCARIALSNPHLQPHIAWQLGQLAVAAIDIEYLTCQTDRRGQLVEDLLVEKALRDKVGAALDLRGLPG